MSVIPKADELMPIDGLDGNPIYEPNIRLGFVNQTQVAYAACALAFKKEVLGKRERRIGSDASDILSTVSFAPRKRMMEIPEDQAPDQTDEPVVPRQTRSAQVPAMVLLDEWGIVPVPLTEDKSVVTYC